MVTRACEIQRAFPRDPYWGQQLQKTCNREQDTQDPVYFGAEEQPNGEMDLKTPPLEKLLKYVEPIRENPTLYVMMLLNDDPNSGNPIQLSEVVAETTGDKHHITVSKVYEKTLEFYLPLMYRYLMGDDPFNVSDNWGDVPDPLQTEFSHPSSGLKALMIKAHTPPTNRGFAFFTVLQVMDGRERLMGYLLTTTQSFNVTSMPDLWQKYRPSFFS